MLFLYGGVSVSFFIVTVVWDSDSLCKPYTVMPRLVGKMSEGRGVCITRSPWGQRRGCQLAFRRTPAAWVRGLLWLRPWWVGGPLS